MGEHYQRYEKPDELWKSSDSRFRDYVEYRQDQHEYDVMYYYTIDYGEGRVELDQDEVEKWIDHRNVSIGPKDLELMKKLSAAGTDHGKFLRMIVVWFDITAPLYWWKEFDTYKVGTVANSCSTMHKIAAKPFRYSDFSIEHINNDIASMDVFDVILSRLNALRNDYIANHNSADPFNRDDAKKLVVPDDPALTIEL